MDLILLERTSGRELARYEMIEDMSFVINEFSGLMEMRLLLDVELDLSDVCLTLRPDVTYKIVKH